jgi:hypothetical protein
VHTKHEFLPPEPYLRFSQRTYPNHYFRSKTHVCVVSRNFVAARHPFRKWVSGCIQSISFCHRNQFFVFRNEHAQTTNFRSKTHVWGGFAKFRCRTSRVPKTCVGVHTKHEFLPLEPFLRFSQRTCPIHYFRSQTHVWGGFAQFRCRTSAIPKMGVGAHTNTSFRHRNHFFIFHNEHVQSTTLGPKLMFGVVSRNFVAARHPLRKRVSGCTRSTSFRQRNHFFVFNNEHAQSTTLGPKLMFGVVSRNFVASRHPFRKRVSGCIRSTSFCHRNHFFIFCNEHAQTTTLGLKLMFVWFRAISLPHVTDSENGCRGAYKALIFATGTISSFFATNMPKPLILGPKLVLGWFREISLPHVTRSENGCRGAYKARVFATGTISSFFATNMPNPLL